MIEKGQILNFIPPRLDGIADNNDRRYMVITNNSNIIQMINISKVQGKEHKMFVIGNKRLKDFKPFRIPSFAKADTLYTIEYFPELENFVSFGGQKINEEEFKNIILERERYIKKTENNKVIPFEKEAFLEKNKIAVLN